MQSEFVCELILKALYPITTYESNQMHSDLIPNLIWKFTGPYVPRDLM